jgi:8-oxo-dGTP pyrophosphatase MutT (NUDIX family)
MIRHHTASAVVIDTSTAQVLLVFHKAMQRWVFPGGHVDKGEVLYHQAAWREVEEETGVECSFPFLFTREVAMPSPSLTLPTPINVGLHPAPAKPDRGPGKPAEEEHEHIDFLYLATADSRAPITAQLAEVKEAKWFSIDDLPVYPARARAEVPDMAAMAWKILRQGS